MPQAKGIPIFVEELGFQARALSRAPGIFSTNWAIFVMEFVPQAKGIPIFVEEFVPQAKGIPIFVEELGFQALSLIHISEPTRPY